MTVYFDSHFGGGYALARIFYRIRTDICPHNTTFITMVEASDMVVCACNSNTKEVEIGGSQVQGQLEPNEEIVF